MVLNQFLVRKWKLWSALTQFLSSSFHTCLQAVYSLSFTPGYLQGLLQNPLLCVISLFGVKLCCCLVLSVIPQLHTCHPFTTCHPRLHPIITDGLPLSANPNQMSQVIANQLGWRLWSQSNPNQLWLCQYCWTAHYFPLCMSGVPISIFRFEYKVTYFITYSLHQTKPHISATHILHIIRSGLNPTAGD